ncbi:SdrH family protein [Staphylococcus cornubiensis]|uniref:SdrH family protein n=1 Tax=Staphylococcus cornubiensis TaxID=1986155 RepID=UPI000A3AF8B2|nr:SdrH family protein [Staphylococcus cornubiensis]
MVKHKKEHFVKRLYKVGVGSASILCVVSPLLFTHEMVKAAEINDADNIAFNTTSRTQSDGQITQNDNVRATVTSDENYPEVTPSNEDIGSSEDESITSSNENVKPSNETTPTDETDSTPSSTEEGSTEEPRTEEVPSNEENDHKEQPDNEDKPSKPDRPESETDQGHGEKPNKEEPNKPDKDKPSKDQNKKPDKGDASNKPPKQPNRPDQKDDQSNHTPPPASENGGNGNDGSTNSPNGGGGGGHAEPPQTNNQPPSTNESETQHNGQGQVASAGNMNHQDASVYQRYAKMLNNNYKYNPLFQEEISRLNGAGNHIQSEITNLSRKEQFTQNEFLDDLQQSTDYFRYQYFNPLSTEQYYHRLDKQVLALVTGQFGSMPDFKKSGDKSLVNKHQQDKVKKIEQHGENFNNHHMKDIKDDTEKSLSYKPMIYIGLVMVGFVGIISLVLWKRLHHFWK